MDHTVHTRKACNWLSSSCPEPLTQMLVWRLCVAPLQHDMRVQYYVSSKKWEHQQRASAARSIREGGGDDRLHRDYRILVAAR
eukprot:6768140-Pyramimonas_sp.AAC.1